MEDLAEIPQTPPPGVTAASTPSGRPWTSPFRAGPGPRWWIVMLAWWLFLFQSPLLAQAKGPVDQIPAEQCRLALGFASLRGQILEAEGTDPVGICLENEYHALSGDGVQWTSRGLFVWRKATNWTGFTDGQSTWVAGSTGAARRLNSDLFSWENSGRPEAVGYLSAPSGQLPAAVEVDEAIRQVFVLHLANRGSTFNLHFGDMGGRRLYAVSVYPDRGIMVPGSQPSLETLRGFVWANRDLLADPRVSLGTWFNKDNGVTYIDISATVPDRQLAMQLGQKYNQIAIFDLYNFEEIPTGGTGEGILNLPPATDRLPELAAGRR